MVDVIKGDTAPVEDDTPLGGPMIPVANPIFDGDAKSMVVTKNVNMNQLVAEIDERLGDRAKYQVIAEIADHRALVSEANPLTLHVHPSEVDMRTVRGVVESHVPDVDHGKTKQEIEIDALKARLAEGDLSLPDLNKILRSIFGG